MRDDGVAINDIEYTGSVCEYGDEKFFESGRQPVLISYMNSQKSSSYVYITTYLELCSNLNARSDFDDMLIKHEGEETQT